MDSQKTVTSTVEQKEFQVRLTTQAPLLWGKPWASPTSYPQAVMQLASSLLRDPPLACLLCFSRAKNSDLSWGGGNHSCLGTSLRFPWGFAFGLKKLDFLVVDMSIGILF